MKVTNKNIQKLLDKYEEIALLGNIGSLLGWDLNVNLPPKASEGRAKQSAYLTKLTSDKWLDKEFKKLVEETEEKGLTENEAAVLRNLKHAGRYYFKVPQKLIVEISETTSKAFMAWNEARQKNDFTIFQPHLKKVVDLTKKAADHMEYEDNRYDALLDMYEPEMTTKKLDKVFGELREELIKLLDQIKKSKKYKDKNKLVGEGLRYEQEKQKELSMFVLKQMGYDFSSGRMDVSPHPFTSGMGVNDVRITNRYKENNFIESIMVAMHEGGHALYEQNVDQEYANTPLGGGVSLGIHESQSRFWENQVGRSREFVDYVYPVIAAFFSRQMMEFNEEDLLFAMTRVEPGLIRVEADEVTYNLHIALRFEIEKMLVNDEVKVKDLPEIWNAKMEEYLGVKPDSDANGVLQDVHWSYGSIGYFPTYTLGNLYAAQFANAMEKDLKLDKLIKEGNWEKIFDWSKENIWQYGSLYWPDELSKKVTGEELNSKYFVDYLEEKYSDIYGFSID